jgi:hypothetical protein
VSLSFAVKDGDEEAAQEARQFLHEARDMLASRIKSKGDAWMFASLKPPLDFDFLSNCDIITQDLGPGNVDLVRLTVATFCVERGVRNIWADPAIVEVLAELKEWLSGLEEAGKSAFVSRVINDKTVLVAKTKYFYVG